VLKLATRQELLRQHHIRANGLGLVGVGAGLHAMRRRLQTLWVLAPQAGRGCLVEYAPAQLA